LSSCRVFKSDSPFNWAPFHKFSIPAIKSQFHNKQSIQQLQVNKSAVPTSKVTAAIASVHCTAKLTAAALTEPRLSSICQELELIHCRALYPAPPPQASLAALLTSSVPKHRRASSSPVRTTIDASISAHRRRHLKPPPSQAAAATRTKTTTIISQAANQSNLHSPSRASFPLGLSRN
jgi:hypothetical protein